MRKQIAALAIALLLSAGSAHAVVPSATVQFPTTGWNGYAPSDIQCGEALGANMNAAGGTDIPIYISAPTQYYDISAVEASNASVSLTTANAGIYGAVSEGSPTIVSPVAFSTLTAAAANAAGSTFPMTLATPTAYYNLGVIYLHIVTAQGAAATADIRVRCHPLYR